MCKINPRVDFAFKKLFGSENNKDLLISLINSIVSEKDQVAEIELRNPYNLADYRVGKMSILDIKAKSTCGVWFNVEMQVGEDYDFDRRSIYYWGKLITEQLEEGKAYKSLQKTICINILDFNFIRNRTEMHNCYRVLNVATGEDDGLHGILELHYIELRKFIKPYHEITTVLDRWSAFLTHAGVLVAGQLPKELAADKEIVKAIEEVDRMFSEEERLVYDVRIKSILDVESKILSAEEKGATKAAKAIAVNMLAMKMEPDNIAKITGLSVQAILEVDKE